MWYNEMIFDEKRNSNETTKDYVYRVLKKKIMNLQLKPGTILSENEIVKELKISRTPVREILKKLENDKLVEIIPQTGTLVTFIDKDLINEVLFMRFVLEKEIIKLLQSVITEDGLTILDNNLSMQEFFYYKNMLIEFQNCDNEFHKTMFDLTNKRTVWDTITNLSTHYDRVRLLRLMQDENSDIGLIVQQHKRILNIIKEKKSYEYIEQVLKEHILQPAEKWTTLFDKLGFRDYIKNY